MHDDVKRIVEFAFDDNLITRRGNLAIYPRGRFSQTSASGNPTKKSNNFTAANCSCSVMFSCGSSSKRIECAAKIGREIETHLISFRAIFGHGLLDYSRANSPPTSLRKFSNFRRLFVQDFLHEAGKIIRRERVLAG